MQSPRLSYKQKVINKVFLQISTRLVKFFYENFYLFFPKFQKQELKTNIFNTKKYKIIVFLTRYKKI